ncbi:MAG TPA: hypothetical protein VGI75_06100, partial [Pirellulales bacterium]
GPAFRGTDLKPREVSVDFQARSGKRMIGSLLVRGIGMMPILVAFGTGRLRLPVAPDTRLAHRGPLA